VCPVCQLIAFVQRVSPDTIDRLADVVELAATGLRDLAVVQRSRHEQPEPDTTAERGGAEQPQPEPDTTAERGGAEQPQPEPEATAERAGADQSQPEPDMQDDPAAPEVPDPPDGPDGR
jgi:hypothetical protein